LVELWIVGAGSVHASEKQPDYWIDGGFNPGKGEFQIALELS